MKLPNTMNPEEAAKVLEISLRSLMKMLASGEFPAANISLGEKRKRYVIYPEHIEMYRQKKLIESGWVPPTVAAPAQQPVASSVAEESQPVAPRDQNSIVVPPRRTMRIRSYVG